jgi:quercetin dioxygenase-like cupin family protein
MATKKLTLAFAAGLLSATAAFSSAPAFAGDCPAGQAATTDVQEHPSKPVGVTDTVLGSVDLGPEIEGLAGRDLRFRKLVIQPGGVVPWHSHGDRPALILTIEGSITEYRSTCAVGIEHPAGDISLESGGISHWWKNNTDKVAVLYAADIKNDGAPKPSDNAM